MAPVTSCAVGIPDIASLSRDVETAIDKSSEKTFQIVKEDVSTLISERDVNIEDILNQLRRIRELTYESETKKYLGVCGKDAVIADGKICRAIYKIITENEAKCVFR